MEKLLGYNKSEIAANATGTQTLEKAHEKG